MLEKFGHKAANCRFKPMNHNSYNTQAHIVENQNQNIGKNFNPQNLLLTTNCFIEDENMLYLNPYFNNYMCRKKELFSSIDESI